MSPTISLCDFTTRQPPCCVTSVRVVKSDGDLAWSLLHVYLMYLHSAGNLYEPIL
jgi:hypothetical protein